MVLTQTELQALLTRLTDTQWLIASLLYGTGMRVLEVARLRVKDVEFARKGILVRDGKGYKDRVTMLPLVLVNPLRERLKRVKALHDNERAAGFGAVYLPLALEKKYPNAAAEWMWQYVFPASKRSVDPRSGEKRQHHVQDQAILHAIKHTVREASLTKAATARTLPFVRDSGFGCLPERDRRLALASHELNV